MPVEWTDSEESAEYGGSFVSKLFGRAGGWIDIIALLAALDGEWCAAVGLLAIGLLSSYIGYRLAGGSRNPRWNPNAPR